MRRRKARLARRPVHHSTEFSVAVKDHIREENKKGCGTNYAKTLRHLKDPNGPLKYFDDCRAQLTCRSLRHHMKNRMKVKRAKGDSKHPLRENTSVQLKRNEFLRMHHELLVQPYNWDCNVNQGGEEAELQLKPDCRKWREGRRHGYAFAGGTRQLCPRIRMMQACQCSSRRRRKGRNMR